MKKIRNFVIGGIGQKVYNLMLVSILLIVAAFAAMILVQSNKLSRLVEKSSKEQKEAITETSRETMRLTIDASLRQAVEMEAYIVDNVFADLSSNVYMLGDYAGKLLSAPDDYPRKKVSPPSADLDGEPSMQLIAEEGVDPSDPKLADRLGLIGNLADMMMGMYDIADANEYYVALPYGVMILVDDESGAKVDENGDPVTIPIRERPWYKGAVETGELFFTDVEKDYYSDSVGVMCAVPVYRDGELIVVIGADLYLEGLQAAVEASAETGGAICIVNDKGHVVFSAVKEGTLAAKTGGDTADLRESDNTELASFIRDSMEGMTDLRMFEIDGRSCYVLGAPIPTVGWSVFTVVDKERADLSTVRMEEQYESIQDAALEEYRSGMKDSRRLIIILVLIVLVLGCIGAERVSKRIIRPLEKMTKRIGSLGQGGDMQFRMEDAYRTGDEIEVLAEAFADISAKTIRYVDQVQQVTAEKERIGTELNMATKIQASQLPRLFPPFPNRTEFDIYASMTPAKEVGGDFYDFFLIDDDHIALVMADVSGKGVPAALFMMVSRVLIKTRLQDGESPGKTLANVNAQLCEGNTTGLFVTVWLGVVEISTGKGVAANAGHEHPVLRRAGGDYELVIYRHSPAVAVLEGIVFREHEFELHPGDSLFVYTDGVPEATDEDEQLFGTDRMLEALNRQPDAEPMGVLRNVMDGINEFVSGAEQFDDITMMCMKYSGPSGKTGGKD